MKKFYLLIMVLAISTFTNVVFSQNNTYEVNGTRYIYGESYKTTGQPKVQRSSSSKQQFLKGKGYNSVPKGYQVDHITPLSQGGRDTPDNMQLITIEEHKQKTARERAQTSTYNTSSYNSTKSSSTYKVPSNSTTKSSSTYKVPSNSSTKPSSTYNVPSYNSKRR